MRLVGKAAFEGHLGNRTSRAAGLQFGWRAQLAAHQSLVGTHPHHPMEQPAEMEGAQARRGRQLFPAESRAEVSLHQGNGLLDAQHADSLPLWRPGAGQSRGIQS